MGFFFASKAESLDETQLRAFRYRRLITLIFCLLLCLSLIKYHPEDMDYLSGGLSGLAYPRNLLGLVGARLGWFMVMSFGLGSYVIAAVLLLCSLRRLVWRRGLRAGSPEYLVSLILLALGVSLTFGLFPNALAGLSARLNISGFPGGVLGHFFCAANSGWLYLLLNWTGSLLVALALLLVPLAVIWHFDWQELCKLQIAKRKNEEKPAEVQNNEILPEEESGGLQISVSRSKSLEPEAQVEASEPDENEVGAEALRKRPAPAVQPANGSPSLLRQQQNGASVSAPELPFAAPPAPAKPPAKATPVASAASLIEKISADTPYQLPELSLLSQPPLVRNDSLRAEAESTMRKLQETLDNFGMDAEVVGNIIGPQVTLFEISPAAGLNIDRFANIQNTICMALEAVSIRMLLPIPGRNLVGIEVPNRIRSIVSACELLADRKWKENRMEIPLLLGKNISGEAKLLDLARAPHLLIAGATGSGKSVCMNLLITSMLYKFKPDELRLIMADPKVVEFQPYSKLPHLIVPVITEAEKVSLALRWAINEMERRYRLLGAVNVRTLKEFNNRKKSAEEQLDQAGNPIPEKLPFIVIIIDEIADVMIYAQKDVEKCLATIVAKSRAVGIHTIIATQRPDTKVLTGTIKNNYPVRIAFQVPSQIDARTIMDTKGAESLLGSGDMLYKGIGMNAERIQGGWVDTPEVENIVSYISAFAEPQFDEAVIRKMEEEADEGLEDDFNLDYDDDSYSEEEKLLRQAVEIILRDKRPTISYVQRSLKIGYNKAATLVDEMEARGILGPQPGSGMREILISSMADLDDDFDKA